MSEKRPTKPTELGRRSLLNLGSGDPRGLARAFQALVGPPRSTPPALDPRRGPVLETLQRLGFVRHDQNESIQLSHPLTDDRTIIFILPEAKSPPPTDLTTLTDLAEELALEFAVKHFPEMDFYLPYISLRANRTKRLTAQSGLPRRLAPEPEYDEDGFLTGEI